MIFLEIPVAITIKNDMVWVAVDIREGINYLQLTVKDPFSPGQGLNEGRTKRERVLIQVNCFML
jgi:hypothetical protein